MVSTMKANEAFCDSNPETRKTQAELRMLGDTILECLSLVFNLRDKRRALMGKYAMLNYIFAVLNPLYLGIELDFLAGNLPSSFLQMRTLLEQLAKCYAADLRFQDQDRFQVRLERIERLIDRRETSTSKIIKEMNPKAAPLWGKLSGSWVHLKQLNRLVSSDGKIPEYRIVAIPTRYWSSEIPKIVELGEYVHEFRGILKSAMDSWRPLTSL